MASFGLRGAIAPLVLACGVAAATLMSSASGAAAATLDVTGFAAGQKAAAETALAAFRDGTDGAGGGRAVQSSRTETFDGLRGWDGAGGDVDPVTSVGRFSSLGGHGGGASAVAGGAALQVRGDNPWIWGRADTSAPAGAAGGNWLDSNDTLGMRWEISGAGPFNAIAFLLTDVADAGAKLSIRVGDTLFSQAIGAAGRLANGSIQLVRILLPEMVDTLTVELRNDRLNDGFGIDGATVSRFGPAGAAPAPVPLPPALALAGSGIAALFALSRRRRRAA